VISHRSFRQALRAFAGITTITVALALPLVAAPALADTPVGWDPAPHVSVLKWLLVLLIIPAGSALFITVLALLPSMVRGSSYRPGETWAGGDEWFGGPSKGVEAAQPTGQPDDASAGERGGAGAEF
jgi:hypothetical protein